MYHKHQIHLTQRAQSVSQRTQRILFAFFESITFCIGCEKSEEQKLKFLGEIEKGVI
jgi:hypothetical protein